MSTRMASRLEEFFKARADEQLRSIIKYEQDDFEIVYVRDNVRDQYTEAELAAAVDDSRFESLESGIYEDVFSEEHGELECMIKCFENAVELNFVLSAGVGTAVALDSEAISEAHGIISRAREIVIEERQ